MMGDALATVPSAPTVSTKTKPVVGDGSIVFTLNTTTGATSYTITPVDITAPTTPLTALTVTSSSTSITVGSLTNGVSYTFQITANNLSGSSTITNYPSTGSYTPMPLAEAQSVSFTANSTNNMITLGYSSTLSANFRFIVTTPATGTISQNNNIISYTPSSNFSGKDSFTYQIQLSGVSATSTTYPASATISITIDPILVSSTLFVPANTSKQLDLKTVVIGGNGITGVSIPSQPAHGTVTMNGTVITYNPSYNYFGSDSFTYIAYVSGVTAPTTGTITVTVGRANPSQDPHVTGIVNSQTNTVVHFSSAQILNFQQRIESRHQAMNMPSVLPVSLDTPPSTQESTSSAPPNNPPETDSVPAVKVNVPANTETVEPASKVRLWIPSTPVSPERGNASGELVGYFNSWQPTTVLSYSNDPNKLIHQADAVNGQQVANDNFASLMNIITELATNSNLNLSTVSNALTTKNEDTTQTEIWASGNLRIGTNNSGGTNTQFTTNGVSVGEDQRLSRHFLIGMGLGYAVDKSTVGSDGTSSKSTGDSISIYSSYQTDAGMFVDALLGIGKIYFETNRYDASANEFDKAQRTGNELFGSISSGYEYRHEGLLLSPYGRYDFSYDKLNSGTETGTNALSYNYQNTHSSILTIGFLGQTSHQTDYGMVQPHARVEFQRGIDVVGSTSVAYADLLGTQYTIAGSTQNTNSIVLGVGSNFMFNDSWILGVDYAHLESKDGTNYQSLNFLLTKTFNEQDSFKWLLQDSHETFVSKPTGLFASVTATFDDNITRAGSVNDQLSDTIYSFSASDTLTKVVSKRHLFSLSAFADLYKYQTYTGLDEISGGLQGEYNYSYDADFGTPIYGIFARGALDQYKSDLRNGTHRSFGVNFRKALTDTINLYSVIADNARTGHSTVFNTHDDSGMINFDYLLTEKQTLYLTGEYRKGDVVSTGLPSLQALEISSWFVDDDVFTANGLVDYRLKAITNIYTLGYNISFGPKDSLDLSWRKVISTPEQTPATGLPEKYFDHQISISYLLAF